MTTRQVRVWTCDRCGAEVTETKPATGYPYDTPMFHLNIKVGRVVDAAGSGEYIYAERDLCHKCALQRWQALEIAARDAGLAIALMAEVDKYGERYLKDPDRKDLIHIPHAPPVPPVSIGIYGEK